MNQDAAPAAPTVVAFHAHPDDEALLTGGTLARLAAQGRRTVIVVACDGVIGEARGENATTRLEELDASAKVLGVARVVHLGYADSGHGPILYPDPPDRQRFVRAPIEEAAGRLAAIIEEEKAGILLSYDSNGGYGHRDHVRVHEVAARAAELTGVRVLQATLPREPVIRIYNALKTLLRFKRYDPEEIRKAYTPRDAITHRIDVRDFVAQKQAAIAAHESQMKKGRAGRVLTRLPSPVFRFLLGCEWFVDPAVAPRKEPESDF